MTYQNEGSKGFEGTVLEVLPKALYAVRLDDGRVLRCGIGTQAKHGIVRVLGGDRVEVSVSRYDPHRGQIVAKL